jgi:hypothetical protein
MMEESQAEPGIFTMFYNSEKPTIFASRGSKTEFSEKVVAVFEISPKLLIPASKGPGNPRLANSNGVQLIVG